MTLPRMYGGDRLSGAYLFFNHTDLHSALKIFGARQSKTEYGLRCYHADDHTAAATFINPSNVRLTLSFRTRRAYEAARAIDPGEHHRGDAVFVYLESDNEADRTLTYILQISDELRERPGAKLLLYSDGELIDLFRGS